MQEFDGMDGTDLSVVDDGFEAVDFLEFNDTIVIYVIGHVDEIVDDEHMVGRYILVPGRQSGEIYTNKRNRRSVLVEPIISESEKREIEEKLHSMLQNDYPVNFW